MWKKRKEFIDKWSQLDHKSVRTIRDITEEDVDVDRDTTKEDEHDSSL
jgi:hypothetical protein